MRLKKSQYATLEDALLDSRVPLRSEDEFRVGVPFAAKLVGCGHVPRPNSRVEIVAAMRRIRCECRARGDKKRKILLTVSYEGVRVTLSGKASQSMLALAQHPIHRIFYVSHDSLDLHIFSYIAREGNAFKCLVFKSAKKSVAVNAVRTIGQAFELCHKMALADTTAQSNTTSNTDNTQSNNTQSEIQTQLETLLREVDGKLDKLADRVTSLETQITNLVLTMSINSANINNNIHNYSNNHCPSPINHLLNSPDSLLSSPSANNCILGDLFSNYSK